MRKRRIDPTLIAFLLIFIVGAALVATFFIFTSIVSRDDARIYATAPTTATPYYPYPPAIPTSISPVFGPELSPRPSAISKTIRDITVSVQPRYADHHRLVITYTISGPVLSYPYQAGITQQPNNWPVLTLSDGRTLTPNSRNVIGDAYPQFQSLPSGLVPAEGVLAYDTSTLADLPSNLTFHITMPIFLSTSLYFPPPPFATLPPGAVATPTPTLLAPTIPPSENLTYDFDFSIPTDNMCRQAYPAVSTEKSGLKITLDAVSITATEARFNFSFSGTFNGQSLNTTNSYTANNRNWSVAGSVDTGPGTTLNPLYDACTYVPCNPFSTLYYRDTSLLDAPGTQWLLKIDNIYDSQGAGYASGPWVFKFDVPPAYPCGSVPTPASTSIPFPTISPSP